MMISVNAQTILLYDEGMDQRKGGKRVWKTEDKKPRGERYDA